MTKEELQSYQVLKSEVAYLFHQIGRGADNDRAQKTWRDAMDRANDALQSIETALSTLKPEERKSFACAISTV